MRLLVALFTLENMESFKHTLAVLALISSFTSLCSCENCDKYGVLLYEDIGCQPVRAKDNQCPSKYECDFTQPNSGCLFKGRSYGVKQEIASELTYSACSVGCRCEDTNLIECAELDCPEYYSDEAEPGCYHGYELAKCCATEQICNSTATKQCEVDGTTYELGQKFYPKNTCLSCVCREDFTPGEYDDQACKRQNCDAQINYSLEIAQNCSPAYFTYHSDEVLCCPDAFVCPDDADFIKTVNREEGESEEDSNSNLECSYGEKKLKLGEGLRRNVNKFGKDRDVQCECILPPLLTCIEVWK